MTSKENMNSKEKVTTNENTISKENMTSKESKISNRESKDLECDLCNTKDGVPWKCINCDESLCSNCKKVHLKSKASEDHAVLSRKEAANNINNQHISSGSTSFCEAHPKEKYHMFCKDCNCLVCQDCIIGDHNRHNFGKITDLLDKKRNELNESINQAKSEMVLTLTDTVKALKKNQEDYVNEAEKLVQDIKGISEKLKVEIDKIRDSLILELRDRQKEDLEDLKRTEKQLETKLSDIKSIISTCEAKLHGKSDPGFIAFVNEAQLQLEEFDEFVTHTPLSPPDFISKGTDQSLLKLLVGYLQTEPEKSIIDGMETPRGRFEIKIMSSLTPQGMEKKLGFGSSSADFVCPINDHEAWVGKTLGPKLALVGKDGHLIRHVDVGFHMRGIAVTQTGEILVADGTNNQISKLTSVGTFNTFADLKPNQPRGLCITDNNEVLVTVIKTNKKKVLAAAVVLLSDSGKKERVMQNDKDNSPLFKNPVKVRQNINADIWVLDDSCHHVVVLDQRGSPRFWYRGPTNVQLKSFFNPGDIERVKGGHMVITDISNDAIYMVDKNGILINQFPTKPQGLIQPMGIKKDKANNFWICGKEKVYIAKIFN